jgi:protein SCO1/2
VDVPDQSRVTLSRRAWLGGALAVAVTSLGARSEAHSDAGVLEPPRAPPDLRLTLEDGRSCRLNQALVGRVTALQIIFTRCQATCPIQGALFAQAARQLGDQLADAQWLSLSIDPTHDDSTTLRAWMARLGAHPRWHAGSPEPQDLDAFVDFLKARNRGADRHSAQVYFFNRAGLLAMRSVDFPPANEMIRVLRALR